MSNPSKLLMSWQLGLLKVCVTCAVALPFLWAEPTVIGVTLLHGLLAIGAWGMLLLQLACLPAAPTGRIRAWIQPLFGAGLALGLAIIFLEPRAPTWAIEPLVILLACAVAWQCAGIDLHRDILIRAMMCGFVFAALWNAFVASVQFLIPFQTDGVFMAVAPPTGRAVGNLFQPNHLANLCLLGLAGCLHLALPGSRWRRWWWPAAWLLCGGLILSGSRMGLLGLLMLVAWGAVDLVRGRELAWARLALVPMAFFWSALRWALAHYSGLAIFERYQPPVVATSDVEALTSYRNVIWKQALVLLQDHPWAGVGWGKFGAYWALTPFERPLNMYFGHAHNLFLHLAVELGLPFALALLVFIAWFSFRALKRTHALPGDKFRHECLLYLGAVMLLHSQLEFPLWYPYFLLPFAALGGFLGRDGFFAKMPEGSQPMAMSPTTLGLVRRGVAVVVGSMVFLAAVHAWHDYRTRVEPVFTCFQCSRQAREALVTQARSSFWFGQASNRMFLSEKTIDLGAANLADFGPLLIEMPNIRLLVVMGRALDAHGKQSYADHIANRLREYQKFEEVRKGLETCNLSSQEFFCRKPGPDLSVEEMLHVVEIK